MCSFTTWVFSVQAEPLNQFDKVIMSFIRLFFPIWFAYLMIMVAFRIGVKKKRDRYEASHLCLHAWAERDVPCTWV